MVVVLEVVDNRAAVELAEKERRAKTAVADDEVGLYLRARLQCLEDAVRLRDLIFEGATAIVRALRRATARLIPNAPDAGGVLCRRSLGDKGTFVPWTARQVAGDLARPP